MAAQFDAMGNYLGDYETEEERKKREELGNTAVHTQEIKTYGDGTQERITKEEIPGAIAPKTVSTPAGPVAPSDPVFQRQLQAESGAQQTDPRTGQIMTSPKGALGIAQIMPATAAQPGYGVPDIFTLAQQRGIPVPDRSDATVRQLLSNKELNQEFGRLYSTAMRNRFGEQAGVAAYNAGPGAVQRNIAANQGQMNVAGLPGETQGYLGRVMRGVGNVVNAVIPSAQAGTLPPQMAAAPTPAAPVAPPDSIINNQVADHERRQAQAQQAVQAQPTGQAAIQVDEQGNRLITNPDGTTTVLGPDNRPLAAGGMEPRDTPQFRNRLFEEAGKDPMRWMEISKNPEYAQFPGMQEVAKQQARTLLEHDFKMEAATKQVESTVAAATAGDPKAGRAIADELKKQEGSWAKMILLGFLSPQLAGEEAVKLGFGNRWTSVTYQEGKSALIQVNAKGMPLQGITPDNKPLSQAELARFAAGGGGARKLNIVGGSYVNDKTGEVGRMITDEKTETSYIQTDTGRKPMAGFRPQGQGGTLDAQQAQAIMRQNVELAGDWAKLQMKVQGAAPEAANKFLGEFNAKHGTRFGLQSLSGSAPQIDLTTRQMTQGAGAAPAPAPALPAAPVSQAAPITAVAPTQAAPAPATPVTAVVPTQAAPAGATPAAVESAAAASSAGATTAAKVTMDAAAQEVAKSPDTANTIRSIQKSIQVLDSGKHNIGSVLMGIAGRGPIAQAIGSQFETVDAKNTKQVMDLVQRLASDGLKALGSNPSTVDLEFWTKFKPDASSDPEFVKEWIASRAEDLQRRVNYARQQMNMEPVFAKEDEQAAYEWTKKNPRDPRTPQIRKKLGLQ